MHSLIKLLSASLTSPVLNPPPYDLEFQPDASCPSTSLFPCFKSWLSESEQQRRTIVQHRRHALCYQPWLQGWVTVYVYAVTPPFIVSVKVTVGRDMSEIAMCHIHTAPLVLLPYWPERHKRQTFISLQMQAGYFYSCIVRQLQRQRERFSLGDARQNSQSHSVFRRKTQYSSVTQSVCTILYFATAYLLISCS